MLRAISFGIPREDAVRAATYNPARQLGCLNEVGSIRDGKQADFVICDAELNRREVWLAGESWPEKHRPEKRNAFRAIFMLPLPAWRQNDDAQRDIPAGGGESAVSTAWVRPPQHGTCIRTTRTGADVVPAEQLRELFAVVHGVELRAADQGDASGKIAAVELRAGKRRAVCGNDKVRALQIGAEVLSSLICTGQFCRADAAPSCAGAADGVKRMACAPGQPPAGYCAALAACTAASS